MTVEIGDNMDYPTMKFAAMEFKSGVNVTVRNGAKWYDTLMPGQMFILSDLEEHDKRKAIVIETNLTQFFEIQARFVENEHEAADRTYTGLLKDMQNTYPGFVESDKVSVIAFELR